MDAKILMHVLNERLWALVLLFSELEHAVNLISSNQYKNSV